MKIEKNILNFILNKLKEKDTSMIWDVLNNDATNFRNKDNCKAKRECLRLMKHVSRIL